MQGNEQAPESFCKAWILRTGNLHVAIGEFELVHIIAGWQRFTPVPASPPWCHHVFLWQDHLLPLFDLEILVSPLSSDNPESRSLSRGIVAVVAYQISDDEICYSGLGLSAPPFLRVVRDEEICDYPEDYQDWHKIALSCFEDLDLGPVPILDIQKIFCPGQKLPSNN